MIRLFFAFVALVCAGRAQAKPWADAWGATSLSGGGYMSRLEGGTTFDKDRYRISAQARTFRLQDGFRGTEEEYVARLTRELFHGTIAGWIGTAPPNAQRAEYHLAGGEARFTFYGTTLGPEHPELAPVVWESSGPAPSPESLDRTWVTSLGGRYDNINNHLERANSILVLVENVWHFFLAETWRERTSVGLELGFDRYNRVLVNQAEVIFKDNIDYPGNFLPLAGWPNNWLAATLSHRQGPLTLTAAGTRLNMLDNRLVAMYGFGAAWALGEHWALRTDYSRRRGRGQTGREGVSLGVTYRW